MAYETLNDGTMVLLREPTVADHEKYMAFFGSLPAEERRYLRVDVTDPAVVQRLLAAAENGGAYRIVAELEDKIVGQAALEFDPMSWRRHLAEARVVVAPSHRARRLGSLLISAAVHTARQRGFEKVVVSIPAPQENVQRLCERLGFHLDARLPEHVVDATGQKHDLVVMSMPLDAVSTALREFCRDNNWPDG